MLDEIKQSKGCLNPCHKILASSKWETCTHPKCAKYCWKNYSLPHTVFSFRGCFWIKQPSIKYPVLWACLMAAKLCPAESSSSLHSDCVPCYPDSIAKFILLVQNSLTLCWLQIIRHFICRERIILFLSFMCSYPGLPSELHISEQHTNSSHASFTPAGNKL